MAENKDMRTPEEHNSKTPVSRKKLAARAGVILAVLLAFGLLTAALLSNEQQITENTFITGEVQVDLNKGETIFNDTDFDMEPGRSIVKAFTVTNTGGADAWYKLYVTGVSGSLKDALAIEIKNGDTTLYHGRLIDMTKTSAAEDTAVLKAGETRTLTAIITMDTDADRSYAGKDVAFDMQLDAVQAKNNPDRAF